MCYVQISLAVCLFFLSSAINIMLDERTYRNRHRLLTVVGKGQTYTVLSVAGLGWGWSSSCFFQVSAEAIYAETLLSSSSRN